MVVRARALESECTDYRVPALSSTSYVTLSKFLTSLSLIFLINRMGIIPPGSVNNCEGLNELIYVKCLEECLAPGKMLS